MNYIVIRRFCGKALCGIDVNIKKGTECEEIDKVIYCDNKKITYYQSENARRYFARNDDGYGLERGELTRAILNRLAKRDGDYQKRWDKIWEDDLCQQYRDRRHEDRWLFNQSFYDAKIEDLRYIAKLINARRK